MTKTDKKTKRSADLYHLEIAVPDVIEYIHYLNDSAGEKPKNEVEFLKMAQDGIAYVLSQNISMLAEGIVAEMSNPLFNTINFKISLSQTDDVKPIDRDGVIINSKKVDFTKAIKSALRHLKGNNKDV